MTILQTAALTGGEAIPLYDQGLTSHHQGRRNDALSITEVGKPKTADRYGLSSQERWLAHEAVHELLSRGRKLILATTQIDGSSEHEMRGRSRALKSMIGVWQKRHYGIAQPEWLEILESTPRLHCNILAAVPGLRAARDLIGKLNASRHHVHAQHAPSPYRLVGYLSKEITVQGAWAAKESGYPIHRVLNENRGPSVTGDRLRLSRDLERLACRTRTYAARIPRKTTENLVGVPPPSDLIAFPFAFWRRPIGQFKAAMMAA